MARTPATPVQEHPGPWQVRTGKLRPHFPTKTIEVLDADYHVVIPWGGFDSMSGSFAAKKRLATRIVNAVNRTEGNS